jgi:hypothetical protein
MTTVRIIELLERQFATTIREAGIRQVLIAMQNALAHGSVLEGTDFYMDRDDYNLEALRNAFKSAIDVCNVAYADKVVQPCREFKT